MQYLVGTEAQLKTFTDSVNQQEGLPKPPTSWPDGFDPQLDWTPSPEHPDPPEGWSVRYYDTPRELVDGHFAISNVQPQHLSLAPSGTEVVSSVEFKPEEPFE